MQIQEASRALNSADPSEVSAAILAVSQRLLLTGRPEDAADLATHLLAGPAQIPAESSLFNVLKNFLPFLCYATERPCPQIGATPPRAGDDLQQALAEHEREWLMILAMTRAFFPGPPAENWTPGWIDQICKNREIDEGESSKFVTDLHRVLQAHIKLTSGAVPPNVLAQMAEYYPPEFAERAEGFDPSEQVMSISLEQLASALDVIAGKTGGGDYLSQECWAMLAVLLFDQGKVDLARTQLVNRYRYGDPNRRELEAIMLPHRAIFGAHATGAVAEVIRMTDEEIDQLTRVADEAIVRLQSPPSPVRSKATSENCNWARHIAQHNKRQLADTETLEFLKECFPERLTVLDKYGQCNAPAASETEVNELEQRLKRTLPPSYKSFLRYCNGLLNPSGFCDLWPTDQVNWFINLEPEWVEIWTEEQGEVPDDKYLLYGEHQDSVTMRSEYLKTALQISSTAESDVLLLNPQVIFENGEWEAWLFGNSLPGANRYKSFYDLMIAEVFRLD